MEKESLSQVVQNTLKYRKTNKRGISDKIFAKIPLFCKALIINYFLFLDENLWSFIFNTFPIQFNTGLLSGPTKPIDSTNNSSPNKVATVNKIDPPKLEIG